MRPWAVICAGAIIATGPFAVSRVETHGLHRNAVGALIATKSRTNVDYGYLLGAALMIGAGLVAVFLAVNAERRSLEDIARPLTARQRPADVAAAPARAR